MISNNQMKRLRLREATCPKAVQWTSSRTHSSLPGTQNPGFLENNDFSQSALSTRGPGCLSLGRNMGKYEKHEHKEYLAQCARMECDWMIDLIYLGGPGRWHPSPHFRGPASRRAEVCAQSSGHPLPLTPHNLMVIEHKIRCRVSCSEGLPASRWIGVCWPINRCVGLNRLGQPDASIPKQVLGGGWARPAPQRRWRGNEEGAPLSNKDKIDPSGVTRVWCLCWGSGDSGRLTGLPCFPSLSGIFQWLSPGNLSLQWGSWTSLRGNWLPREQEQKLPGVLGLGPELHSIPLPHPILFKGRGIWLLTVGRVRATAGWEG